MEAERSQTIPNKIQVVTADGDLEPIDKRYDELR
jgi:hypothetical protein